MKLITFTVPCYNSQGYMRHCLDTLLTGGDKIEIIIVNDGSSDGTAAIADEYAANHPSIIKVVHKENGGHGSGVNCGLERAEGLYYKVVDSDDWVNEDALKNLLDTVEAHVSAGVNADLYITNYVYEHAETNDTYTMRYTKNFPVGKLCTWKDAKGIKATTVLMMHALMYRTQALRDSNTSLPEHTFYVDNIYAYKPLPFMKTIFYLNADLYRYFIGRADQSVNIKNFVKRYTQQIRVMKLMLKSYTYAQLKKMTKGLRRYMFHSLDLILLNTILFIVAEDSPERRDALKEFWNDLKCCDKQLYRRMRFRTYAALVNFLPWKLRAKIMLSSYNYLCKRIKLG